MLIYKCYYEDGQLIPANLAEYTKEEIEQELTLVKQGYKSPYSQKVLQESLDYINGTSTGYELGPDQADYYRDMQTYEDNMKKAQEE